MALFTPSKLLDLVPTSIRRLLRLGNKPAATNPAARPGGGDDAMNLVHSSFPEMARLLTTDLPFTGFLM
jgi:hypothetical protein